MSNHLLLKYLRATAARMPEAVAIVDEGRTLTYAELLHSSGQLAVRLAEQDLPLRGQVGVYLTKSLEAISAFHGILRAGGCYVPLDASILPPSRVARIVELGDVGHIVTDSQRWSRLLADVGAEERGVLEACRVIFVDEAFGGRRLLPAEVGQGDGAVRSVRHSAKALESADRSSELIDLDRAYILFTSGSTGVPKGVMISHRNAMTFVDWAIEHFQPPAGRRFACHASINFDLSVFDIYVSIATGGTLVLVPHASSSNPRALLDWIGRNRINYWYSVPSVWISLLNHAEIASADLSSLEWILFAGEIFPAAYLKRLMRALPHAKFINLYGPTETNVCTWHQVRSPDDVHDAPVPIGRACANYDVVILNERFEPCARGEEGELMVFGAGVTTGYYKNSEATQRAFVRSPLPRHEGRALYRTGDIVKENTAGLLEYVGRNDFMVKIAGFRVELQEVETHLYKHPSVKRAVALSYFCEERGTQRLGALVQWHATGPGEADHSILKFKAFLTAHCQRYMIPEIIFAVDDVPHNANGKVDRSQALQVFRDRLARH